MTIYELAGFRQDAGNPHERVELFSRGRGFYKRGDWRQAQAAFTKVPDQWPDDGPSRVFAERCEEFLLEEPEPQWDGVYVMKHK